MLAARRKRLARAKAEPGATPLATPAVHSVTVNSASGNRKLDAAMREAKKRDRAAGPGAVPVKCIFVPSDPPDLPDAWVCCSDRPLCVPVSGGRF